MTEIQRQRARLRRDRWIVTICGSIGGAVVGGIGGGISLLFLGGFVGAMLGWVWLTDKIWEFEDLLEIKEKRP